MEGVEQKGEDTGEDWKEKGRRGRKRANKKGLQGNNIINCPSRAGRTRSGLLGTEPLGAHYYIIRPLIGNIHSTVLGPW